jgi:WhiB family redox-sensing transcriptional regulator|tara:strand:+ start:17358 stop:17738 length:381 start_codon:yes stop_codon:yes gene_type:complete
MSTLGSNYKKLAQVDDRSKARKIYQIGQSICPDMDDWQLKAACRGVATEVFFPVDDSMGEDAKSICLECPVARQCLEHAIHEREEEGVWGGATGAERRSLVRRRRRAKAKQRKLRSAFSNPGTQSH